MAKDLIKQLQGAKNYYGDPNDLMPLDAVDVTDPQISEMAAQALAPIEQQDLMSVGTPIESDIPNDYVGPQEKTIPIQQAQNPITSASSQKPKTDYDLLRDYKNIKDSELSALQRSLADYTQSNTGTDLRPIAAWVSGLTGNKQLYEAASAMAPKSSEEMAKTLLDKKIEIAKMASDHKYAADMVRIKNEEAKNQAQLSRAQTAALNYGLRMDTQSSKAVDTVMNDKALAGHTQRILGADRILGQLELVRKGEIVDTSQFLNDLNTEYVNLLTGANNSALGKLERTEYKTAASQVASIIQQITGHPESIKSPEILKQLEKSVIDLKGSYQKAIDARADILKRNFAHNPQAQEAQRKAIEDMKSTYGSKSSSLIQNQPQDDLHKLSDEELLKMYQGGQ